MTGMHRDIALPGGGLQDERGSLRDGRDKFFKTTYLSRICHMSCKRPFALEQYAVRWNPGTPAYDIRLRGRFLQLCLFSDRMGASSGPIKRKKAIGKISLCNWICAIAVSLSVMSLLSPSYAQDASPDTAQEARAAKEYEACMVLARKRPEEALESGLAWSNQGGGAPAQHCVGVALIELGRFEQAAIQLEKAVGRLNADQTMLAAELLAQAAQAWIQAEQLTAALQDLNTALSFVPNHVDLLTDRALLYGQMQDFAKAIADLSAALKLAPKQSDLLVFRASAYRQSQQMKAAEADLEAALAADSKNPAAYLERGLLFAAGGNLAAARQDWLKVLELAPATPLADAAQHRLEASDIKIQTPQPQ